MSPPPAVRRVLHITNGEYLAGAERVLLNYLAAAERRTIVTVAHVFDGETARRLRVLGIPTHQLAMQDRADLLAYRRLRALADEDAAEIYHSHQVRTTLLARLASWRDDRPVVTHVHSPAQRESTRALWNRLTAALDRSLAGGTDRFICVSRHLADELVRSGISQAKIAVVPNGVDPSRFEDRADRGGLCAELGLDPDRPIVAMVALFRPRKGAEVVLEALSHLAVHGQAPQCLLVGAFLQEPGRDYEADLRNQVARAGLDELVTFTGFRDDIPRILASIDALLLPSLFGEGMPMVVLEAMATGRAVIATNSEGLSEAIEDGVNGLLVPPSDSGRLADAIRAVARSRTLRDALGAAARETVRTRYSADTMARGIDEAYASL
jgi:glycosyltransferase involved in cell wall biosynthesis